MRRTTTQDPNEYFWAERPVETNVYRYGRVTNDVVELVPSVGEPIRMRDSHQIAALIEVLSAMYQTKCDLERAAMMREGDGGGSAADAVRTPAESPH
jgi:hypothetical protein